MYHPACSWRAQAPAVDIPIDPVHRHDGYVVQSIGDGIFALFGAPVAHEDLPQRALNAVLRLQEPGKIPTYQMASLLRCDLDIYARLRAVPSSTVDPGRNE